MTDIDFDELDKAVSSAMASANQDNTQQTVKLDTTSSAVDARSSRVASRPIVANPRTGRFMDFVPSNSDTSVKIDTSEVSVSREIDLSKRQDNPVVTNEPVRISDTIKPTAGNSVSKKSTTEIISAPVETNSNQEVNLDIPDLDSLAEELNKTVEIETKPESPIESPFLQNAKIDKRPLGTFSEGVPAVIQPNEEVSAMMQQAEEANMQNTSQDEMTPEPSMMDSLSVADSGRIEPQADTKFIATETSMDQVGAVGSITPQYQTKPSITDQTNGSIYDTNDYHKVALQPKRKKSVFVSILWTLLLIIIGASTGAAVYFFVLPNINI